MRIGLINQPIHRMIIAHPGAPLYTGSISLGIWHLARSLGHDHAVSVLSRASLPAGVSTLPGNVPLLVVPEPSLRMRFSKRVRGRLDQLIGSASRGRPYFAQRGYSAEYGRHVSRLISEHQFDFVRVHNFFQLVPLLKRDHPHLPVNLHMHCEWLHQMDEKLVIDCMRQSDFLSAVSSFVVGRIKEKFPMFDRKMFTLQNGVDTSVFTPDLRPMRKDSVDLLYVGRVSPEKGVHVLLMAFREMKKVIPSARLTIIGSRGGIHYEYLASDPDPLVRAMERYLSDKDAYQRRLDELAALAGSVTFVPEMPQADLPHYLRGCDIFVFPSVWHEAFGMPPAEAMACAKPVVATYSGGIPEFVKDGENGRLVDRGDVKALAAALIELARDPAQREYLGRNAREFVEKNLTWEHISQTLLREIALRQPDTVPSTATWSR